MAPVLEELLLAHKNSSAKVVAKNRGRICEQKPVVTPSEAQLSKKRPEVQPLPLHSRHPALAGVHFSGTTTPQGLSVSRAPQTITTGTIDGLMP